MTVSGLVHVLNLLRTADARSPDLNLNRALRLAQVCCDGGSKPSDLRTMPQWSCFKKVHTRILAEPARTLPPGAVS
jgi:hypothetical protein